MKWFCTIGLWFGKVFKNVKNVEEKGLGEIIEQIDKKL